MQKKRILVLLAFLILVTSTFTAAVTVGIGCEESDEKLEVLVYKDDIDVDFLRERYETSALDRYDENIAWGEFSLKEIDSLKESGYTVESVEDNSKNIEDQIEKLRDELDNSERKQVEIDLEDQGDRNSISYEINDFDTEGITIDGKEYHHISLEEGTNSLKKGHPQLPTISRSLIIPDDKEMDITVEREEYEEYGSVHIAPSKGSLSRCEDPSSVPYEFGDIYDQDDWYPQQIARLRDPHIIRDFRGQAVEITPFRYHPIENRLRVYTELDIEIFPTGRGGENTLTRSRPLDSIPRDFARIYERRFINYEERLNELRYDPVEEEGDMLVISYDGFSDAMGEFVDWKNNRGLPTELVELSEIGNTADDVEAYIENYYHEEDLTYVLLVGDNDHVPTPSVGWQGHASDPTYSFIEGDDAYPDIFVGRFSASEESHVETQVERSISYEEDPMEGDWTQKAMGLASDEGPGYQDMMDYEHMDMLQDRLLDYDYTHVDRFYDSGYGELPGSPDPSHVSDGLEDGRHLINYVGHGVTTGIETSGFTTDDIAGLENDKLPFFILVACLTGEFDASADPCFGEKWTRATHEGEPTGGIAAFASSKLQAWEPPMAAQDEMMDLYTETYQDNIKTTTGGIAFNGCMFMNDEFGSSGEAETETWHLFGDPSLDITGEFESGGPDIELISPEGGETWEHGDIETIEWDTEEDEDPIDSVDLEYSTDGGESWIEIETDVPGTGSYEWEVPDMSTDIARIQATVSDVEDITGTDQSKEFTILGDPPEPVENLEVVQSGILGEAVENGNFIDDDDPWELDIQGEGDSGWDGEEYYEEGGSIYSIASQEGDGESTQEAQWEQDIIPIGNEIVVNGAFYSEEYLEHDGCEILESTVEISVHDTEAGWQTIYSEDEIVDDWTEFGPDATYTPDGLVDRVRASMRGTAEGHTEGGIFPTDHTATIELWMDGISVESIEEGTEHNRLTWDASPEDPEKVSRYNLSRSEEKDGDFEEIGTVEADGSNSYEYFDEMKGTEDEIWWYYQVNAECRLYQRCDGSHIAREPGIGPYAPEDPQPQDGATDVSRSPELSVYVEHATEDPMDVTFHDASDDSLIGTVEGVATDSIASTTWEDLDPDTMYEWYAVADDDEETVGSNVWSFTTTDLYTLTTDTEGEGTVDVAPEQEGYEEGTEVTLRTDPAEGWEFIEWGGTDETGEEITITMDEDKSITATFEIIEYQLTINIEGEGSTDPEEGSHTYEYGTEVNLRATSEEGWEFVEWTGTDETGEEITIIMDEEKSITASFELIEYELTINIEGEGSMDPVEGTHTYEHGTEVELTAYPAEGYEFKEWIGVDESGEEITITMDEDKSITARFEILEYSLDVSVEGDGSVDKNPDREEYEHGTEVTLTAEAGEGFGLTEWLGTDETGEEITIIMDEDKSITTRFEILEYSLDVSVEGDGSVDKNPDREEYEHGTEVGLVAVPEEEWYFDGWTGDMSSMDEEITLDMDSEKEITANFEMYDPAYFEVEIIDHTEEAKEGEEIALEYQVKNTGELEDTQDIILKLGGEEIKSHSGITLRPGEEYHGGFTVSAEDVGEHDLEISSRDSSDTRIMMIEDEGFLSNYWWIIPIIAVVVVIIVVLFFMKRKEEETEEGPVEEESPYEEPPRPPPSPPQSDRSG